MRFVLCVNCLVCIGGRCSPNKDEELLKKLPSKKKVLDWMIKRLTAEIFTAAAKSEKLKKMQNFIIPL